MNLIISLLGSQHENLFKERFIYNKKEKNTFLLDQIIKRFDFCNKIFIISEKLKIVNKSINFNLSVRDITLLGPDFKPIPANIADEKSHFLSSNDIYTKVLEILD